MFISLARSINLFSVKRIEVSLYSHHGPEAHLLTTDGLYRPLSDENRKLSVICRGFGAGASVPLNGVRISGTTSRVGVVDIKDEIKSSRESW